MNQRKEDGQTCAQRSKTQTDAARGLTAREVQERKEKGLVNLDCSLPTKTVGRIVRENACTLFNLINLILAVSVFLVGSYKNLLFMGVVLSNLAIGIVQEIRAKRTVDKLSFLSAVRAHVVRDGKPCQIPVDEVVLDDVLELASGGQVAADCILLDHECEVNESFVTGESDAVIRQPGELLLAGSFVVSGSCRAVVAHVGADNYISTISRGAKELRKAKSEIMAALNKIIKFVSLIILPLGALLFLRQFYLGDNSLHDAVVHTVAAVIGMIPEGLVLLTSTVLAVSVIRLSRHKVLVQELYCIEALARVDTLCLDKTGTLTEGTMEVAQVIPLCNCPQEQIEAAVRGLVTALEDRNATFEALAARFSEPSEWQAEQTVPFSSQTKWSGASFAGEGSYLIGAAEFLFPELPPEWKAKADEYAREGRVLLLAHSSAPLSGRQIPGLLTPLAFLQIRDTIRPEAGETLRYFAGQGVDVKVISGDNVLTVSQIARRTGIAGWESCVDASTLKTDEEVKAAASRYTVFGRVLPTQKKLLVQALQEEGHTVAMTGDGVNDVLALKEADCSIAMASGSDAARNISQLVLLNSNFDSMPRVVAEGRRSINNIQRSASLFLVKTMYSALLAVIFLFLPMHYPFMPIQLTLISTVTIGIPALVLALEPNTSRVKGNFLKNVLQKAVPGAVTIVTNILLVMAACGIFQFSAQQMSTMCVVLTGFSGLMLLYRLCIPFTPMRKALFVFLCALFAGCAILLHELLSLTVLPLAPWLCMAAIAAVAVLLFHFLLNKMNQRFSKQERKEKK